MFNAVLKIPMQFFIVILGALLATLLVHALFYDNFFSDPVTWITASLLATGAVARRETAAAATPAEVAA